MATTPGSPGPGSPDPAPAPVPEERVADWLLAHRLVTADDLAAARATTGADTLLARLMAAGVITRPQAKRAVAELARGAAGPIPGYELLEKIGEGSMGVVHKARQISLDRLVAVKVLHPRVASRPRQLEKLEQEARLAARLSHNNVVQAIDFGAAGATRYFVMELVEGRTIRQDLEARGAFDEAEATEVVLQVAQALAHAHRRGLFHRDVKPANIVRTADGVAKLADLGLARAAGEAGARGERGFAVGTPFYMAPEVAAGRGEADGRSDLYSLGATFYHMVTGRPPFPGPGAQAIMTAHLEEEVVPPDHINPGLSAGLGEVVEILLAKSPTARYQTADDLVIDLECLLAGEAPRLARKRIAAGTLAGLAEGEEDAEHATVTVVEREGPPHAWLVIAVLGTLFGLSLLLNLILIARR